MNLFKKTFKIKLVWIAIFLSILLFISIYFVLVYLFNWTNKEAFDYTVRSVLVIIAFLTLLYHLYNLENQINVQKTNNKQHLAKYTYDICSTFRKPEMIDHIERTRRVSIEQKELLKNYDKMEEFEAFLNKPKNSDKRKSITLMFNYFEGMSAMVLSGDLDMDIVKRLFGMLFGRYYKEFGNYIDYKQEVESPKAWCNFEKLAKKWLEERKS